MEAHYGWAGYSSEPTPVSRLARSFGSSIDFPFGRDLETDPKARLALGLFREARTINSVPYAFLGYFKILNIFWDDAWDRKMNVRPIEEGIRTSLAFISDSQALSRLSHLVNTEADVPKYLYVSGRCAVAHAHKKAIADPDDLEINHRLSQDMPIIKAIAEHLMTTEFKLSRSIIG